jgi:hypothetical protein
MTDCTVVELSSSDPTIGWPSVPSDGRPPVVSGATPLLEAPAATEPSVAGVVDEVPVSPDAGRPSGAVRPPTESASAAAALCELPNTSANCSGDACLAEAKLLLEVPATGEEVGDAVLGVGEPLGEAGEEGRKEAGGEAGLIGCGCARGREVFEFEVVAWVGEGNLDSHLSLHVSCPSRHRFRTSGAVSCRSQ